METIPSLIPVCQRSLTCQPLNSPRLSTIVHINAASLSLLYINSHHVPISHNITPSSSICHVEKNNAYPINFFPLPLLILHPLPSYTCFLVLSIFRPPRLSSRSVVSASFPYLHDSRNVLCIPTVQVM